jgi:hypothetical protein
MMKKIIKFLLFQKKEVKNILMIMEMKENMSLLKRLPPMEEKEEM